MDFLFSDIQNKYNKLQKEKEENRINSLENSENEKQAESLFQEAFYETKTDESIKKALEAYELNPLNYQYKLFALLKYNNKKEKLKELKDLLDIVNKEINNSKTSLYPAYDESEVNKDRYIDLRYAYIISLIENENYKDAIDEIVKFSNYYGYYEKKVKHLLLNSYNVLGLYDEVIATYGEENDEDVCVLIPVSYAYIKLKKYKDFDKLVARINRLTSIFDACLSSLDLDEIRYSIEKSRDKYLVGSTEEIYYAFKYFIDMYSKDEEYISAINMYKKNVN